MTYYQEPFWLLKVDLVFGGISTTLEDKLQTLTGTRTAVPDVYNDTPFGHIGKSPDRELSVCSVTSVCISFVLRTIHCRVLISPGHIRKL